MIFLDIFKEYISPVVTPIKWLLEKKRKRAELKKDDDVKRAVAQKLSAQKTSEESNNKMLSKPCPFLDGDNCKSECVHFDKSFTFAWPNFDSGIAEWHVQPAKCKLCGKK